MNSGHEAKFTQSISQLSLNSREEEIKEKGWWQFLCQIDYNFNII